MSELTPGVSVVIPTYNCARYLPEAIDSVLAQTYKDFEIIVVDDGSTDSTPEVLARYDNRIRIIRQPNQGRSAARNTGSLSARGEYIAFLDADDLWLPEKLAKQMPLFDAHPEIGWVYSDYRLLGEHGTSQESFFDKAKLHPPPEGRILLDVISRCITWTSTVVARAECLCSAGLFNSSFPVAEDYDMWLRLAVRSQAGCVDEVLALYRQHALQATVGSLPGLLEYHRWRVYGQFLRRHCRHLPVGLRLRATRLALRGLAESASSVGTAALAHGNSKRLARLWLARAAVTGACDPGGDRRLVLWSVGKLLDTLLPLWLMQSLRAAKQRTGRAAGRIFARLGSVPGVGRTA